MFVCGSRRGVGVEKRGAGSGGWGWERRAQRAKGHLGLALLVLEGAVEEEDARLLDAAAHLAVDDVLVEHDALEHARVLDVAARDLLDLGVPVEGGRGA